MITVEVKIPNLTELVKEQSSDIIRQITLGVRDAMTVKHADAPRGGREYRRGKDTFHEASAAGEPPAVDSSDLKTSLQAEPLINLDKLRGEIYLNDYGFFLEEDITGAGKKRNVNIAARPWIVPSFEEFMANYQ